MDIPGELKPKILFPGLVDANDEPAKGEVLLKLPKLVAFVFKSALSALEVVDSADTVGGSSDSPNLIGGSVDTEDAAAELNRQLPEVMELPAVLPTAVEMLVEGAPSLELPD